MAKGSGFSSAVLCDFVCCKVGLARGINHFLGVSLGFWGWVKTGKTRGKWWKKMLHDMISSEAVLFGAL